MAVASAPRYVFRTRHALLYVAALALVVPSLIPFIWMLATSLKPQDEIYASPPRWWPNAPTLAGYANAILKPDVAAAVFNSLSSRR